MSIVYGLLCFICLIIISFTTYDIKYLSLVDEDFINSLPKSKNCKLDNKTLYENKILFLELINLFGLSLGLMMAFVLGREIELAHNIDLAFSLEYILVIVYGILVIFFAYFLPRALARRHDKYEDITLKGKIYLSVYPLYLVSRGVKRSLKKQSEEEEKIDEDVLHEMVDSFEEEGVIEEDEAEMVRGAIDLHNIEAHEVMTPRVDVFAIDVKEDITALFKNEDLFIHSRIPVYEETIDHIIGVVSLKDLCRAYLSKEKIDLHSLCYQPLFIPSNIIITDLLDEFRNSKTHIAVVLDEFGGTKGIVTMEDILEEIVGDIYDEMDEVEEEVIEKSNGDMIVDGSMNVDDFFQEIGFEEEYRTDFLTVSGFIQELLGRFPKKGDIINFHNYQFKVLSLDGFVIDKLEVKIIIEE